MALAARRGPVEGDLDTLADDGAGALAGGEADLETRCLPLLANDEDGLAGANDLARLGEALDDDAIGRRDERRGVAVPADLGDLGGRNGARGLGVLAGGAWQHGLPFEVGRVEPALVQGEEDLVLVLEVPLDGAGRVLDLVGDTAHRRRFERLLGEELHGGRQDQLAHLLSVAFSAFRDAHDQDRDAVHLRVNVQSLNAVQRFCIGAGSNGFLAAPALTASGRAHFRRKLPTCAMSSGMVPNGVAI